MHLAARAPAEGRPQTVTTIHWLVQRAADHPFLASAEPPPELLSAAEETVLRSLSTRKRRQDWLLGRWTAKQLLQAAIWQRQGIYIPLAALTVLAGAGGAPTVQLEGLYAGAAEACTISISHSQGTGFCALAEQPGSLLGADLEWIEPRTATFVNDYFTDAEQEQVAQASPQLQPLVTTAIWSAKEAALKAVGVGLNLDTRSVACDLEQPTTSPRTWAPVALRWDESRTRRHLPPLQGWWRANHGFVQTLAAGSYGGAHAEPHSRVEPARASIWEFRP